MPSTPNIILCIIAFILWLPLSGQPITQETEKYITDCDTFTKDNYFRVSLLPDEKKLKVFAKNSAIYCSPDTNSHVIDTLFFNSDLIVSESINRYTNDTSYSYNNLTKERSVYRVHKSAPLEWYKITSYPKPAYIKKDDLALEDYAYYGLLAGIKKTKDNLTIELKSIDKNDNSKIKDTFSFQYLSHGYELFFIPFNGLEKSEQLIKYRTYRESCPGGALIEFVIFNETGFTKLISSYTTGEGESYDMETVYLPMKFENGKILLVANADLENIFNPQTAELNVFPYPKNFSIPIQNLIVKTREYTELILDKNKEPIPDEKTGGYKVKVIKEKPKLYKWDGKKLIKL